MSDIIPGCRERTNFIFMRNYSDLTRHHQFCDKMLYAGHVSRKLTCWAFYCVWYIGPNTVSWHLYTVRAYI